MKKLSLVALFVILSACKSEKGDAIHAKVLLPNVLATCVRFEVRDPSGGQATETRWLKRTDDDLQIAIFRGSLPDTVELAAQPYVDGDCEGGQTARTPNGREEKVSATFLKDEITSVDVTLRPGTDGDGDGYVGTGSGGSDCADAPGQQGVNPGAQEQCTDQIDRNCDNKKGCEAPSCGANACAGPPADLALTLQASSVQFGACTSATIQVKDASNRDTSVSTTTVVGLEAAPASGVAFFSNPACTTSITNVTLAVGEGGATFYFRGQVVGTVTLNATAGQLQDSKDAQVVPGPGNRLVITSPARTATAGTCSTVQFQSQDAQGSAAPVTAATAVALAASPATGFRFYSDPSCATEVTSVTIAPGSSTGGFGFKGTKSGTVTVTLTTPGIAGTSQNETINPGPATAMVFTGPQMAQAGVCSSTPVTIELRDAFDNPATAAEDTTINLTTTGVSLAYSTNTGCSPTTTSVLILQRSGTVSFRYRGIVAGTATISGTATGLTPTPLGVTIAPGPAASLVFTTTAQTLTAGSCSAVATVRLRDSFNNPIRAAADTPVALSAAPSTGFQFFTDSNCTPASAVMSVNVPANGSDASFYFKGTSVGTGAVTISATVTGVPAVNQSVTLNPGPPTVLAFSQPSVAMVAGVCTQITVLAQDGNGNSSPVATPQSITFAASPSTGFTFSANTDCSSPGTQFNINGGQSSRVLYMSGTAAGSVAVTASGSGFTTGTLPVTVNPAAPSKLAFQTASQRVERGACSGITTVQVQDTFTNPSPVAANTPIDLAGSTGNIAFYSDAGCNNPAATVTVSASQHSVSFYFKDTVVEDVTITASNTGGLTSANQTQTITPLIATRLAFTTAPQTVQAGACSGTVIVETQAVGGTPTTVTSPTTVTFGSTPAGFTFYSNSDCSTSAPQVVIGVGQGTALFYFKSATAGTFTLSASTPGLTSANQNATILPTPTKLLFTTPPFTTTAGACSSLVTVQSTDNSDTPVPVTTSTTVTLSDTGTPADPQFAFYSDSSCGTSISTVSIPAGQSTASFYYRGERARTANLRASATGLTAGTQAHTIVAGALVKLGFSVGTPAQTLLIGACSAVRNVESQDTFGNPKATGSDIAVTLSGSAVTEFFSDAGCTIPIGGVTIATGTSSASFYFKPTTGTLNATATLTLTAAASGLPSGTQGENILPTVRTGACTMVDASITCPITPALLDINKTLLVFQATSDNNRSDQANVRCFLSSLSQVTCERHSANGSDVNIRWNVAEFPSGVRVQHQAIDCVNNTTPVALTTVAMDQSFLLLSSYRDGNNLNNTVPRLAELTTPTQAEIRKTGGCSANDHNHLQAVTYPGASVQRGLATLNNGSVSTQVTLTNAVAPDRSALLYSYINDGSGAKICDRVLRGELTNGGANVSFSRGEGDTTNCVGSQFSPISWEVVQFPVGTVVQQVTKQLTGGAVSVSQPISPVDLSRTLVIGGGQWASGQLHGEGRYSLGEIIGEMRAQAYLTDNTTLNFYRDSSLNSAKFTAYVIQFKP